MKSISSYTSMVKTSQTMIASQTSMPSIQPGFDQESSLMISGVIFPQQPLVASYPPTKGKPLVGSYPHIGDQPLVGSYPPTWGKPSVGYYPPT